MERLINRIEGDVVAVGRKVCVRDTTWIEEIQKIEYKKVFNVARPLSNFINQTYLISGAFGLYRKSSFEEAGRYAVDIVGEDMEICLRLKEKVEYEESAVCFAAAPRDFKRLMRQRDRWQRRLLDCILRHWFGWIEVYVVSCELP